MKAKHIVIGIVAALVLIVIFQNTEVVAFQFLVWKFSMSRIVMLSFLLIAGFLLGLMFSSPLFRRGKPGPSNPDTD